MRVVYANAAGELGGAEFSLLDLLESLGEVHPNLERHLIAGGDGPLIQRAKDLGVTVHPLFMPSGMMSIGDSAVSYGASAAAMLGFAARSVPAAWQAVSYTHRLRRLLIQLAPEIIHSNSLKMHCLLSLARPRDVPVIWHIRDWLSSRAVMSKALRWTQGGAASAIAVSEAVRRDAVKILGATPVQRIYNAIDVTRFSPGPGNGAELDRQAGLPPSASATLRVGLVATYALWKGHLLFLEAAAHLARRRPELPVRYFIIGGPIYRTAGSQISAQELAGRIAALRLGDRAGLVPFQSEPACVYRALDIVVHASTRPEPFGRTIAEAMACGRPVIVSRDGGAADLFTEDLDAIGFQPGDPSSLAAAMESLSTDPYRRARLAEAARQSAVRRFSRRRLAEDVLRVYDQLYERRDTRLEAL